MGKPWYMYDITVPFGNPNYDSGYGGSHDMDIGAPPNYEVTNLLAGRVASITRRQGPGISPEIEIHLSH